LKAVPVRLHAARDGRDITCECVRQMVTLLRSHEAVAER
jgi:hypothetical protein